MTLIFLLDFTRSYFICFSISKNLNKICDARNSIRSIECLDGIRVLSYIWIVFYHSFSNEFTTYTYNSEMMTKMRFSWKYAWITKGNLAVDSFLTMTGLLISYQYIEARMQKYVSELQLKLLQAIILFS